MPCAWQRLLSRVSSRRFATPQRSRIFGDACSEFASTPCFFRLHLSTGKILTPARLCALFQHLRVCLQITHCVTDTSLNRHLRPPAKCLELGGIEMHEWGVTEPTALASSREVSNCPQAEFLDDDVC